MSVRTMARVWEFSQQSGSHLLMLLAIADFADDSGNAYPAVATLARKCRMQPRNAQVLLAALRDSGELQVRPNEGPKGSNRYRIVLPQGVQSLAGVQILAGVQGNAPGGAKACAKPLQGIAPEPSLNHQEPKREGAKRPRAQGKATKNKTPLPADFGISDSVQAWAAKHGHTDLAQHLEAFVIKAKSRGYTYADWDAAFMGAIRSDWAGLKQQVRANSAGRPARLSADEVFS